MLISTQTQIVADRFGEKKAIEILKNAGFDAADFSIFGGEAKRIVDEKDLRTANELGKYAASIGMKYNQAHAPFVFPNDVFDNYKTDLVPIIETTLEICAELGVEDCIVHPIHHIPFSENGEKLHDINIDFYNMLRPTAERTGVKVALENMFQWDPVAKKIIPSVCGFPNGFTDWFDELNSDAFTCCLDVGHAGLVGTPAEDAIRILGHDRLGALHVHDNNNVSDQHTIIGHGKINWDGVAKAFAEIDYKGVFTLETDNFVGPVQTGFIAEAERYMYEKAKTVVDKIEEYKKTL